MAFLGLERVHFQDGTQVSTSGQWAAQMGLQVESPRNFSAGPLHGLTGLPNTVAVQFQERKVHRMAFYGQALEVTERHLHCFLLGGGFICIQPFSRKKDRDPSTQ